MPKPIKSYQQLLREEEARQRIATEDVVSLWALLPPAQSEGDAEREGERDTHE